MRLQCLPSGEQHPGTGQGKRLCLRDLAGGDDLTGLQQRLHLDLCDGQPATLLVPDLCRGAGLGQNG